MTPGPRSSSPRSALGSMLARGSPARAGPLRPGCSPTPAAASPWPSSCSQQSRRLGDAPRRAATRHSVTTPSSRGADRPHPSMTVWIAFTLIVGGCWRRCPWLGPPPGRTPPLAPITPSEMLGFRGCRQVDLSTTFMGIRPRTPSSLFRPPTDPRATSLRLRGLGRRRDKTIGLHPVVNVPAPDEVPVATTPTSTKPRTRAGGILPASWNWISSPTPLDWGGCSGWGGSRRYPQRASSRRSWRWSVSDKKLAACQTCQACRTRARRLS